MKHMTESEYNALPGVRWSNLKHMRVSASKVKHSETSEWETTAAQALGSLVHCALLESATLNDRYVVLPPKLDGRTREGKAQKAEWDELKADAAERGVELVDADMWDLAITVTGAIEHHPVAGPIVKRLTHIEHAYQWSDGGVQCKARVDGLDDRLLVDVKSTRRDNPKDFAKDAASLQYVEQLAFYRRGLSGITGARLIVASTVAPYDVAVFDVGEMLLEDADHHVAGLIAQYRECERNGRWPGYGDDGVLALSDYWPSWADIGNVSYEGVTL